jgi:sugar lactone lactonase YvrE
MARGGIVFAWFCLIVCPVAMAARYGSGIVVDGSNDLFFADTGAGVWKIDGHGELSLIYKRRTEWIGMDSEGRFSNAQVDSYRRITPKGASPSLLVSNDHPIAISQGNLYFASSKSGGPLHIMRIQPDGDSFVVAKVPDNPRDAEKLRRVNGIGLGPDGSIYISGNHTIRRVTREGAVSTVVGPLKKLDGCTKAAGSPKSWRPYLRGLAVDAGGTVYAAASGCGEVLKIAPDGAMTTVLKAESPWSPTGVAISGGDLYVLEYRHGDTVGQTSPRVRKLAADGKVTVVGTVKPH